MKQPQRLTDAGADEFERGLLSSSSADAPSDHAYHRTLASLGVGLVLPLGTAGAAHGAAGVAATSSKLGATVLGKWLATGMALGAVTVSAVTVTGRVLSNPPAAIASKRAPSERPSPTATVRQRSAAAARTPAPEPRIEPAPAPEAAVARHRQDAPPAAAEAAPATTIRPNSGAPAADPPVKSVPSIKRETELIGTAQHALQSGDGQGTLSALERYRAEFPDGALGPEARLLELSALLRTGQHDRARSEAAAIIAKDPTGQEANAARALLTKSQKP